MFDRRLTVNFDWTLFCLAYAIALIGIVNLFSASPADAVRQIAWLLLGTLVLAVAVVLDYHLIARLAYAAYVAVLVMLVLVFFVGRSGGGALRWLPVGPVAVQPSEFAKLAVILVLARYFSQGERGEAPLGFRELLLPGVLVLVPTLMVARQPDLGTALIVFLLFCAMVAIVGVRRQTLLVLAGAALAAAPLLWQHLKPYQRARLLTFLDPEADPQRGGYQILQSKIAIGSGKLFGKGFTAGTQSQLQFLPEHATDFAFAVWGEEWGFLGAFLLLLLYLILVLWGLNVALKAKDRLGALLAYGVTAMLFLHVAINIGMVTGMLPVVGVPLLLVSYGGSSLVTTLAGIGLLLNVSMRRYMF
ncbi:MAG TPA: rod shape-determining protein RodA [Thermodesulfobacteriota bacterium]|nr:rod shape-determining protein RodA [Thermodesulfobacteriota bacterium]